MNPTQQNLPANSQIPQEIHTFLESLLTDSGMSILDEETKEEMIKEMYVRLDNYIASIIIDKLPPEHLETFSQMNEEKKSKEEVEKFLKEKMPNYHEVFAEAFANFRQLYIGNVTVSRNSEDIMKQTQITNASVKKVN